MPFSMWCPTKGCRKQQEPFLNPITNEVECSECGGVIPNVSHFVKVQMKSLGQTKKHPKSAFAVRCDKCKTNALPKLGANDKLVCVGCGAELVVSKPFEIMARDRINKGNSDI
jgi:ribosomal protein S27E